MFVCLICLALLFLGTSCLAIKPYQRVYLDDAEMSFGAAHTEQFELKVMHYREGGHSSIKNKSSGGCGCN